MDNLRKDILRILLKVSNVLEAVPVRNIRSNLCPLWKGEEVIQELHKMEEEGILQLGWGKKVGGRVALLVLPQPTKRQIYDAHNDRRGAVRAQRKQGE